MLPKPIIVGHRGFKALYPENTLLGFQKAVDNKIPMIEFDIQMTLDGIVVLNHDYNTGRCWDKNVIISEVNYLDDIVPLNNKMVPDEKMITLKQFLLWSTQYPDLRLMLDCKFTNKKLILLKVFNTLLDVVNDIKYWQDRLIWGVWELDWLQYGVDTSIFRGFEIIVITGSIDIAKHCIDFINTLDDSIQIKLYGISIHYMLTWTNDFRKILLPLVQEYNINIFVWTLNKKVDFKYLIGLPIYGVVTDNGPQSQKYLDFYYDRNNENIDDYQSLMPTWNTWEGLRFYSLLCVFELFRFIITNKFIYKKICGFSLSQVIFAMIKFFHIF